MNYSLSDEIIINGIKEGNSFIFELLYERYYTPLIILARRYLQNSSDCEDCLQTVFMRIWTNHKEFEIKQSLNSYLFTAVKNECLNHISKNKKLINTDFYTDIVNQYDPLTPESILELQQLTDRVKLLISELPERAQEAFKLSRFQHKTYKEIATILDISIKTVESDISKAISYIKIHLPILLTLINLISIG